MSVMGSERVMLGSDTPFPLGEEHPGKLVRGSAFLDDRQRGTVLGGNAIQFFDL